MATQEMQTPCPCFGKQLRRFRDRADMSLEKLAELTGTAADMVDEVERGRRAVSTEWVQRADEVLDADGMLCIEAGECLSIHAGLVPDIQNEHVSGSAGPIRLPALFTADAA
jgi:transcriptional regulator with XRE-family HTH domain